MLYSSEGSNKYKLMYHQVWTKKFQGVKLYAYPQFIVEKGEAEVWMKTKHQIIFKYHGYTWQNIGIQHRYPTYYSVHNIEKEEEDGTIFITGSLAQFNMKGESMDATGPYGNDKDWPKKMTNDEFKKWQQENTDEERS